FMQAFKRAGYVPRIAMQVGDIFSLINLVSGGIGFSLLPGRIASFSSSIKLVKLEKQYAPAQRITLVYAKHREQDTNILALAAECRMYGRTAAQR
ncbi:MAG: LysR substrate-binding domain-containing protein, partial [Gallionella sp.]